MINPKLRRVESMHARTLHLMIAAGLAVEAVLVGVWSRVSPPQATAVTEPSDASITHLVCTYGNQVRLRHWMALSGVLACSVRKGGGGRSAHACHRSQPPIPRSGSHSQVMLILWVLS